MLVPFRGDTGKFRQALEDSYFPANRQIYNDNNKSGGRRLKLWTGDRVFNAPPKQQKLLERNLRKQFGKRIISMYFIEDHYMGKALCIQLNS